MRIGEIENLTGLSAGTIRYWEERGLISFERAENSYRDISDMTIELLKKIKLFRELDIAIADIKLWCDGVLSENDLLIACKNRLEADSRSNLDQRELCERLINGKSSDTDILKSIFDEKKESPGKLSLGVDIGTTSISAKLVSLTTGAALHTYTIEHNAGITPDQPEYLPDAFAANASKLLDLSLGLVRSAVNSYPEIVSIGFTGQMHGIICLDESNEIISPLYTWQNQFGLRKLKDKTICSEIFERTGQNIPTGYGLVTYYAMCKADDIPKTNGIPFGAKKIACIADVAASKLCGLSDIYSHPTNAASLGLFDIDKNDFDISLLNALGIDRNMLPKISKDFSPIGEYNGIKVATAVGDNQAGVFGSLSQEGDILLNVGTSGQVSFVSSQKLDISDPCCEIRPYFGGSLLHSGSTLCGGRAYAMLADLINEILDDFGIHHTRKDIYAHLNNAAEASSGSLNISTKFSGSRSAPNELGNIQGITTSNFNISELSGGFLRGIVDELYELYNKMTTEKPKRLIVSGNAMRYNPKLRKISSETFGCDALLPLETEEAAFGTALYAAISAGEADIKKIKETIIYKEN